MSVFTELSEDCLNDFVSQYNIGQLQRFHGISGGVTNTIYHLSTSQNQFILTLFETPLEADLSFYLDLNEYLAGHGLPCAHTLLRNDQQRVGYIQDKPAIIQTCLAGHHPNFPNTNQCAAIAQALAKLHCLTQSYPENVNNPCGVAWFGSVFSRLESRLSPSDRQIFSSELSSQQRVSFEHLPGGIIHADLFPDNALFKGDTLTGLIDFYYACSDAFIYDIAICLNAWCWAGGQFQSSCVEAFLENYSSVRPLQDAELELLPTAQRRGALRFWCSRLLDYHFPAQGKDVLIKDPAHYREILLASRNQAR